jgi:uncharacterized protein YbjT (DUF2867 family)
MSTGRRRSHERRERLGFPGRSTSGIGADLNSESSYVRSRALGERAVREAYPDATILCPSVLFGRGDTLFRSLAAITRASPVFPLFGDGTTRLQPVFVGDVAQAVVKAVGSPATREKVYELGGPRVYRYRELVELVLVHLKRRRVLVPVPFFVWEIQATLLGILPNPPLTRDQVILMRRDNVVSETALTFADLSITPRRVEAELPAIVALLDTSSLSSTLVYDAEDVPLIRIISGELIRERV